MATKCAIKFEEGGTSGVKTENHKPDEYIFYQKALNISIVAAGFASIHPFVLFYAVELATMLRLERKISAGLEN